MGRAITTGRIQWEFGRHHGTEYGHVGTRRDLFTISWHGRAGSKGALRTTLPGMQGRVHAGDDPEALKVTAETWLAEFVTSLGAQFPVSATVDRTVRDKEG